MVPFKNYIYFILLFLFVLGLSPATADNITPQQTVKKLIDLISSLKTEKSLSSSEQKTNQDLSHRALNLLDLNEVSRKTLGKHWKNRTSREQQNFIDLLSQMFIKEAFPNSGKFFSTLKLIFGKTKTTKLNSLVPITVVHTKEGKISIDFHLLKNHDSWQVVDVYLDEISMRNNLRSQVYKIIAKKNYRKLIHLMEKKLKETNS